MHATLPKVLLSSEERKRIEDMEVGEEGIAMPYVMAADADFKLWLDPGAFVTLNEEIEGSFIKIKRVEEGYEVIVDPSLCDYRWERGNWHSFHQYSLPVVDIVIVEHSYAEVSRRL